MKPGRVLLLCWTLLCAALLSCSSRPGDRTGAVEQGLGETVTVDLPGSTLVAPATVTVAYGGLPGNTFDWVALAPAGSASSSYTSWRYTNGAVNGAAVFTNVGAGNWVARAYLNNTFNVLAESAPFAVTVDGATAVTTDKAGYQPSENIVVSFSGMAGNAYDWVSVARQGSPAASFERWAYSGGLYEGQRVFDLAGLSGSYVARVFFNNSYVVAAESAPFLVGAQLSMSATSYAAGDPVTLSFANLPGNLYDWIAVSRAGSPASSYSQWAYTLGTIAGTHDFNRLPSGTYVGRAYLDNGFTVLMETPAFNVAPGGAGAPAITTDMTTYVAPSVVTVAFSNLPANARDWVALAPAGSSNTTYLMWSYTNGSAAGTRVFGEIPAGTYVARAYENDTFAIVVESPSFTVAVPAPGSGTP